mgnify:CR=1 FL=1
MVSKFIKKINHKESFELKEVGKIITLDLEVLEHVKSYNTKSPLTIITKTLSKQILKILFFGKFKSFYISKFFYILSKVFYLFFS